MSVSIRINPSPDSFPKGMALALGIFDGFHRGHQALADQADALVTLSPHPELLFDPNSSLRYLSTLDELRCYHPQVFALDFTSAIASLSASEFLDQVLLDQFSPSKLVCGHDYRFGKKKEGDVTLLKEWSQTHGILVSVLDEVSDSGQVFRSGAIRQLIDAGTFEAALESLGHAYLIKGTVVKGDGRGRGLGFPTANLDLDPLKCIPQNGVYRGFMITDSQKLDAIIYIGGKPTYGAHSRSVEVHVLDFSDSLYGDDIVVGLNGFIRGEQQFDSSEALVAQIKADIKHAFD